jgi:hypothetical protein
LIGWAELHLGSDGYTNKLTLDILSKKHRFDYDLTKSLTENLQDNEELTNFLYELLTNQS